jgi:hypothetical protein
VTVDPNFRPQRVVIAIPTITERQPRWASVEAAWKLHTCEPLEVIFSTAPGSWAAGLNAVWRHVAHDPPDVFVCGSDDMIPADDNWLPPLLRQLAQGLFPAPCVIDPRFTNHGGHPQPVPDGTPSDMSSFPVIRGDWGPVVFPLPENLHYYSDNLIAVKLDHAGVKCVACPSTRIDHLWAKEGRGAGEGSEESRMLVDTVRYTAALAELGIDRQTLPLGQKGPLA